MRGTVAKKLRRIAMDATIGLKDRKHITLTHRRAERFEYFSTQIINDPETTRGVYRQLKRAFKAERRREAIPTLV